MKIDGIYVFKTKTFYYYDDGQHTPSVEKCASILLARGLITYVTERVTHEVMNIEDAKEKGYKIEVLYGSKLIKSEKEKVNPWRKKE